MASASSVQQGLAESGELINLNAEFEDPARSWIDLVVAFKAGNPTRVRECLTIAKHSHWNHDDFDRMMQDTDDEADETVCYNCKGNCKAPHPCKTCNCDLECSFENTTCTNCDMDKWLKDQKQQTDDFFEE